MRKDATKLSVDQARALSRKIQDQLTKTDADISDLRAVIYDFDTHLGWNVLGHANFESWAKAALPWARSRCFEVRKEALVAAQLRGPGFPVLTLPGPILRLLEKVLPADRPKVYKAALEACSKGEDGEPIVERSHVSKAVREWLKDSPRESGVQDEEVLDGFGAPVTDPDFRAIFGARKDFDVALALLGKARAALRELGKKPGGAILAQESDSLDRHLRHVVTVAEFSLPHAVCSACGGSGTGGKQGKCRSCLGHRFVNAAALKHQTTTREPAA